MCDVYYMLIFNAKDVLISSRKNKNDAKLFHDLIARISNCANKTNSKIHRASKLVPASNSPKI